MNIANKVVLITGANRGIGRALVNEALTRGARRILAGARSSLQHTDKRVTPLMLNVTSAAQIQRAAAEVDSLDVLINNAGVAIYDDLSNPDVIQQHLAVNLLGSLNVTRAFLPLLRRSRGAVVNNLSLAASDITSPVELAVTQTVLDVLDPQQLGTTLEDALFDPNTSVTAGLLNAVDDLATAVLTANDDFPSQLGSLATAEWANMPELAQATGTTLLADLSALLNPADFFAA